MRPERGSRVIVPFRNEKLIGVVVATHSNQPEGYEVRPVESLLDDAPLVSDALLKLAEWMAGYYLAPLGEVLRTMLPLMAEVKKTLSYRITDAGRDALARSLDGDTPLFKRKPSKEKEVLNPDELNVERRVLERLASGDPVKVTTLRSSTGASLQTLSALLRRKWIFREYSAASRDARRMERFVVLIPEARLPRLTDNQQAILAELAAGGGELPLAELHKRELSSSTVQTLVRRGLVKIEERQQEFRLGGIESHKGEIRLNETQTEALAGIATALGSFKPFLLHGVTGSGKTAVYIAAMKRVLEQGMSAILLVPEIGLTPQTAGLLHEAFAEKVALLHSALTPDERSEQWRRIHRGEAPIVVGTRSAIFAPVPNLGLILVDEEHDQSYKQEETPRYNGRDVAVMRGKLEGAVVVLGSATPSLESWNNATQGRYGLLQMKERVGHRPLPEVEVLDMRKEFAETGRDEIFSRTLVAETQATLDRGEQAMILLNRRGYSFSVLCRACGVRLECENCAVAMTHHKAGSVDDEMARVGQRLECHLCGARRTVPDKCPQCSSEHLYYLGAGSEQGEEKLAEIFPNARIGRMDRDTVRGRFDLERLLARLHSGEINLLVGTQMIAKGHDIHGVTLVGVVGCDHSLSMPDFRAAERVFQLMTQVAGRAGRGTTPGRVIVQSYYPDHYAVEAAAKHDFDAFVTREMKYRRWMHYPPFGLLANVLVQSNQLQEAAAWSATLGRFLQQLAPEGIRVLGPSTAPIARIKGIYRFHLILKAASRKALNATLRQMLDHAEKSEIPRRALVIDVDALRLM